MPNDAHWSKDFVEHLRTVHFALLAVATGLIVLVLSSREYNAATARVEIEEIVDLKQSWSPAWMEQFGEGHESNEQDQGDDALYNGGLANIRGSIDYALTSSSTAFIAVECVLPKENWRQSGSADAWSPSTFPGTLSEFEKWWDNLGQSSYIIYLPKAQRFGEVLDFQLKSKDTGYRGTFRPGETVLEGDKEQSPQYSFQLSLTPSSEQPSQWIYHGMSGTKILNIHIYGWAQRKVTQDTITRRFRNLRGGRFGSSFADLAQASKLISDLPLEDVRTFIRDEAAKGPEAFEAFGVKFPAGQVALWGTVLMLGIQLYFLTYLQQLSGKLAAGDPGWDVPWIGMNPGVVAQSIFFATIVPLPSFALVLLSIRRTIWLYSNVSSDKSKSFGARIGSIHLSSWAEFAGLLLACFATIVLALLCWRYRPKVKNKAQSAPITQADY
jgi:hypothetical protein